MYLRHANPFKQMVGPATRAANDELTTSNRFFLFDLLKSATSNIVYGLFNYLFDNMKKIATMKWKDMLPADDVKVTELVMMIFLGLIAFKMVLRVLIFCAPLGKSSF